MAKKDMNGKPQLKLLKRSALEAIARVREFGINKYQNDMDWMYTPSVDYIDASLRHLYKYLDGEDNDKESGLCHLAHAMTSLMLAFEIKKMDEVSAERYHDLCDYMIDAKIDTDEITERLYKDSRNYLRSMTSRDYDTTGIGG